MLDGDLGTSIFMDFDLQDENGVTWKPLGCCELLRNKVQSLVRAFDKIFLSPKKIAPHEMQDYFGNLLGDLEPGNNTFGETN